MSYRKYTAIRLRLLVVAARLQDLQEWEPVGSRLEDLRAALVGFGGITDKDLQVLQAMADRWLTIDPRLRDLYRKELGGRYSRPVSVALTHIMARERRKRPPGPNTYGAIRDLWVEHYGHPPSIEMIPRVSE